MTLDSENLLYTKPCYSDEDKKKISLVSVIE